ncbi:uncharacterized protein LAESUDRAFT_537979 [Laetiporus sulphureus 93-53]|uniref:Kinase n=1 Tax=Laetiporus sulphureus 93-53 TaxID=1314785 RepID=A0A165FKB0_9APHY|nr:uncharacterized protein LAESUDRAFT_537979 [Laetiporus sulphureus 93-53]KZT09102.1 hypothetical protein LAESUDRAFT_537979 [Laetiporus sulphureus 93-53]
MCLKRAAIKEGVLLDMKFGSKAWPLRSGVPVQVVTEGIKTFRKYNPKSDVSWWRNTHVLLLAEIQSGNGDDDYIGALCEGAYHVRLANANAKKMKMQDLAGSAVVVAFHVSGSSLAKLYYLFQEDPADVHSKVKNVEEQFTLSVVLRCQAFMQVLYNYVDLLIDENKPSRELLGAFFEGVPKLPTLTSTKRPNEDQDHAQGPSKQKKAGGGQKPLPGGGSGGNQDQAFTTEQYVLVPSFDFDFGTHGV